MGTIPADKATVLTAKVYDIKEKQEERKILENVTLSLQTDYTRALNFKDFLNSEFLFNADLSKGSFMHYNGKVWEADKQSGSLIKKAFEYSEMLSRLTPSDEVQSRLILATIKAFQNDSSRNGILRTLRPMVQVDQNQFDTDSKLINLENCTIDLNTQKVRDHNKNDFITKIASGSTYEEEADMSLMKSVVDSCFENNDDDIKAFETMLGGALLGELSIMPIWLGSGDNGKSLIIKAITAALGLNKNGGYIATPSVRLFLKSKMENASEAATPGLYLMRNAKLAFTSEAPVGSTWDDSLIKKIATHEYDSFRQLNQESIQDRYTCTLINDTNNLPHIKASDHGMTKRLKVYKFPHTFVEGVDMDVTLEDKLKENKAGVIKYLLYCVEQFINNGRKPFYSENVVKNSDYYKETNDTVQDFIDEYLILDESSRTKKTDINKAWEKWAACNSYQRYGAEWLREELSKKGIQCKKKSVWYYVGVKIKTEYDIVSDTNKYPWD